MSRKSVIMDASTLNFELKTMWTGLAQFLDDQCKQHGWSWREASLRAGLDHGAISRFMRGTTPATDSCYKLAELFGVDAEIVLKLAGHWQQSSNSTDKPRTEPMLLLDELMQDLPEDRQWKIFRMARVEHEDYQQKRPPGEDEDDQGRARKAS